MKREQFIHPKITCIKSLKWHVLPAAQGVRRTQAQIYTQTCGQFQKLFCALCPTFEKLFTGIKVGRRRKVQMYRYISMICALRTTFLKSTPGRTSSLFFFFILWAGLNNTISVGIRIQFKGSVSLR